MKYKQWPERVLQGDTGCRFHLRTDEVQQVGTDDSADIRQEVSSSQHFKENSELKNHSFL